MPTYKQDQVPKAKTHSNKTLNIQINHTTQKIPDWVSFCHIWPGRRVGLWAGPTQAEIGKITTTITMSWGCFCSCCIQLMSAELSSNMVSVYTSMQMSHKSRVAALCVHQYADVTQVQSSCPPNNSAELRLLIGKRVVTGSLDKSQ